MGGINLSATMDALATAFSNVTGVTRAFAWPTEDATPGTAVVGYPDGDLELVITFQRGADKATFPVWIVCGLVQDEETRDFASALLLGSADIIDAVDGTLGSVVQYASTKLARFERVMVAGMQHLSVRFDVEVVS